VFGLAGCKAEDEIRTEVVSHADREPIRLRVAVMQRGKDAWFFRISGPEKHVTQHEKTFEEFVRSAKFDDKKEPALTVTEPKEWKKDPPGGMRFAGYRIPTKPKEIEVTITRLGGDEFSLLQNVRRWQKQVHVPEAEKQEDLDKHKLVRRDMLEDQKQEVIWVNLDGLGVHTVSAPPTPPSGKHKFAELLDAKKQRGVGFPFKFKVPEGWTKKPARQFVLDVYEISDGDKTAEVTLANAGGSVGSNIARWHGNKILGLGEIDDKTALGKVEATRKIAGTNMLFVDLQNPRWRDPDKNRILGVIIPAGRDNSWFVKMTGPIEVVGKHKNAFVTFVESFQSDAP